MVERAGGVMSSAAVDLTDEDAVRGWVDSAAQTHMPEWQVFATTHRDHEAEAGTFGRRPGVNPAAAAGVDPRQGNLPDREPPGHNRRCQVRVR